MSENDSELTGLDWPPSVDRMHEIYRNMKRLFDEVGPEAGLLIDNREEMEILLRQGKPLLARLSEAVEFPGFEEIFETFSQYLLHQSTPAPDACTLVSEIASGREEYWQELSSWWGIEPAHAAVLGMLSAKPYLMATAREVREKVDLGLWQRSRCPVCFSFPSMAGVDSTRGRHLFCSLCETEWPYSRPGCVFCGCLDAAQVIRPEEAPAASLWLDLCDSCERYLKTSDGDHDGPPLSATTDIDTFNLDITAQEMDYQREAINPVGVLEAEG